VQRPDPRIHIRQEPWEKRRRGIGGTVPLGPGQKNPKKLLGGGEVTAYGGTACSVGPSSWGTEKEPAEERGGQVVVTLSAKDKG